MPISRPSKPQQFEKVRKDEWIVGTITEVQERTGVKKTYKDDKGEIKERTVDQVRFKFELEGYEKPHYSKWMTNVINEKSNLFKFLQDLYGKDITPEDTFDLDLLTEINVKTMWDEVLLKDGTVFQFVDKIRPVGELPEIVIKEEDNGKDEKVPF